MSKKRKVSKWLTMDSNGKQKQRKAYDIGQLFCMSTDRRETDRPNAVDYNWDTFKNLL